MCSEQWLKGTQAQTICEGERLYRETSPAEGVAKTTWQASRENQQEYQEHEFCRATDNGYGCLDFVDGKCRMKLDQDCTRTAKEFHHWLKDNGYKIVKEAG